jgi:hypothetical protein
MYKNSPSEYKFQNNACIICFNVMGTNKSRLNLDTNNVIVQKLQIATHWKGLSYAYQTSVWQTHWWQIASMDCLYRPMVRKDTIFLSVITGFKNSFWCHEETHYVWGVVIIARKNRENPPYEDKTHSNIYSTPKMCYWQSVNGCECIPWA